MANVAPVVANRAGPGQVQLNPERVPSLLSKWRKLLGKTLKSIEVSYTADGVSVDVFPMKGTPGYAEDSDGEVISISIAAYKAAQAAAAKPSADDSKVAFRNKFELRLNQPFPENGNLGDGSDAAIQTFLQGLPFAQRRAMLMSNKQFKSAYPNGFGAAQAAPQ